MLPAIRFDDEPLPEAGKVDNVAIDRKLPLEFVTSEPLRPQDLPKTMFRGSLFAAHSLCVLPRSPSPL
jgi:hypothetical protein